MIAADGVMERGIPFVPAHRGPSWGLPKYGGRWRPPMHMPRWASRYLLDVVDVRLERLQEITEAGALAEGVPPSSPDDIVSRTYAFGRLWDSINATRNGGRCSWKADPWVWVITFKLCNSTKGEPC